MWAAESHRHTEALGSADDDVSAQTTRRLEYHETEQVSGNDGHRAALASGFQQRRQITHFTGIARILEQRTEDIVLADVFGSIDDQLKAEVVSAGTHHVQCLRQHVVRDEEAGALVLLVATLT